MFDIIFGEGDEHLSGVVDTDIGRLHQKSYKIQYVRAPSSRAAAQWQAVALSLGIENVNDLIDSAATWVFLRYFKIDGAKVSELEKRFIDEKRAQATR